MISFKHFITEAKMAPLYHGTSLEALQDILANGIRPQTIQRTNELLRKKTNIKDPNKWMNALTPLAQDRYKETDVSAITAGVSFSRSIKLAAYYHAGKRHDVFVVEVDQQRLQQRYKIIPYQYFQGTRSRVYDHTGYRNEYEEFVLTTTPIDPKYITTVHYLLRGIKGKEMIVEILKEKYPHIQFKPMKEFVKDNLPLVKNTQ